MLASHNVRIVAYHFRELASKFSAPGTFALFQSFYSKLVSQGMLRLASRASSRFNEPIRMQLTLQTLVHRAANSRQLAKASFARARPSRKTSNTAPQPDPQPPRDRSWIVSTAVISFAAYASWHVSDATTDFALRNREADRARGSPSVFLDSQSTALRQGELQHVTANLLFWLALRALRLPAVRAVLRLPADRAVLPALQRRMGWSALVIVGAFSAFAGVVLSPAVRGPWTFYHSDQLEMIASCDSTDFAIMVCLLPWLGTDSVCTGAAFVSSRA